MPYCTASDISKDFANLVFDTTSKVKAADLDEFITDADALIDSYLASRYVTPVTATESVKVLKLYSRTLVSDKVKGILEIKQVTNQNANQNVRSGLTTRDVIVFLEDLRDSNASLPDADLISPGGGITSFNARSGQKTQFKKNQDNW